MFTAWILSPLKLKIYRQFRLKNNLIIFRYEIFPISFMSASSMYAQFLLERVLSASKISLRLEMLPFVG